MAEYSYDDNFIIIKEKEQQQIRIILRKDYRSKLKSYDELRLHNEQFIEELANKILFKLNKKII